MYCVLRTNHAKFAKETSSNFRNIQHLKVHTFFWNRVYARSIPAYFLLSLLQKHVRKVVGGFGKKNCVSTGVRKPGNTYASPTDMI